MVAKKATKQSTNGRRQADEVPPVPFAEIGSTGLKRFGGEVQEEFDPNLRGIRGVRVYDEMRRNDADVGALLFAILHVALASTWEIEAASDSSADKEASEWLSGVLFEDMSHSWRDFVVDAMSSNAFGWAWFEIVFKQRLGADFDPHSKFDDGRIGIRKLALRGQETLAKWIFDPEGGVKAMVQRDHGGLDTKIIPIEKSLLVRPSSEKNNPEGFSLLRTAYRPYFIKTNIEEIEVIGAERDMTGVLKIMLPSNAQDADFAKAREMGERYKADDQTYFTLQQFGKEKHEGWDVDTVKSPGSKVVDTDKTILRNSAQIMKSVLASWLTLGQGRTGSFALADAQKSLWTLAVGGRLDTFSEEINRFLIPKLFALNTFSGTSGLPKIVHSDPGEIDLKELTPLLRVMGELGLVDPSQETMERLAERASLPIPPEGTADEMKREREEAAAAMNAKPSGPPPAGKPDNLPNDSQRQHQT